MERLREPARPQQRALLLLAPREWARTTDRTGNNIELRGGPGEIAQLSSMNYSIEVREFSALDAKRVIFARPQLLPQCIPGSVS